MKTEDYYVNTGRWQSVNGKKDKNCGVRDGRGIAGDILKDGICIGQIYLARAESRKLRYWAISCMSGIGFNTFNEARSYAKDFL